MYVHTPTKKKRKEVALAAEALTLASSADSFILLSKILAASATASIRLSRPVCRSSSSSSVAAAMTEF